MLNPPGRFAPFVASSALALLSGCIIPIPDEVTTTQTVAPVIVPVTPVALVVAPITPVVTPPRLPQRDTGGGGGGGGGNDDGGYWN